MKEYSLTGLFILLIATTCLGLCGCQEKKEKKEDSLVPRYTMDELRQEAGKLNQKYSNMDFSESEIIIPDGD